MSRPARLTRPTRTLPLLLALTLAACGETTETGPTPPPDAGPPAAAPPAPELWTTRALIADGPPAVTGGSYVDGVYERSPTYETCTSPTSGRCLVWTSYLPVPPAGMTLTAEPHVPILFVTGQPVTITPQGLPPCNEPLESVVMFGFGRSPKFQGRTTEPITVPPGASSLTVEVCFYGEVRAQVGNLTGTLSFARWQPLHR